MTTPGLPPDSELAPGQPVKADHLRALRDYITETADAALAPSDEVADAAVDRAVDDGRVLSADEVLSGFMPAVVLTGAGIDPTGVADSTAAIQAKLDTVPAGGTVAIPAGVYRLTGALTGPVDGVRVTGAPGTVLRQTTWNTAVFDLIDRNGWTVEGLSFEFVGTRDGMGTTFRSDARYTYGSAVWTNGSRHTIRGCSVTNMAMGFYFSSWDGTGLSATKRTDNRVFDCRVVGVNHGVLFLSQERMVVDGLSASGLIDDSAGLNPLHAVYCTGNSAARSSSLTVRGVVGTGWDTGHVVQVKYADNVTVTGITGRAVLGLLNLIDVNDFIVSDLVLTDSRAVAAGAAAAVAVQTVVDRPRRGRFHGAVLNTTSSKEAGYASRAFVIVGDDIDVTDVLVTTNRSSVSSDYDFNLQGDRITVDGATIRNLGSAGRSVCAGYTSAAADVTVRNMRTYNSNRLLDVYRGSTGCALTYERREQRAFAGATDYTGVIGPAGATTTISVTRTRGASTVTPTVSSGNGSSSMTVTGNDHRGRVTFTTNAALTANAGALTVTFGEAYGVTPNVQITPATTDAARLNPFIVASSATSFVIALSTAPGAALPMAFDYLVTATD